MIYNKSMKNNEQLINNIIGQLEGIKKMVDKKEECEKILIQLKASKSAISSLMDKLIEESAIKCLKGCSIKERVRVRNLIKEIIKK